MIRSCLTPEQREAVQALRRDPRLRPRVETVLQSAKLSRDPYPGTLPTEVGALSTPRRLRRPLSWLLRLIEVTLLFVAVSATLSGAWQALDMLDTYTYALTYVEGNVSSGHFGPEHGERLLATGRAALWQALGRLLAGAVLLASLCCWLLARWRGGVSRDRQES